MKIDRNKVSTVIAIIVIIFILSLNFPNAQAQTNTSFTPSDKFLVPAFNGSISFAVNGTYSSATFENNTWIFTNLSLKGSQPIENFEISTQNSNVTISSYITTNGTAEGVPDQTARLRYVVEGKGEQILNFGVGSGELEWTVSFNGHLVAQDEGWNTLHNGIAVTGATGSISVTRYFYYDYNVPTSNLSSFYQQHSVAIITAMIVAITVVVAVVIKVKNRASLNENGLVKNA